jgi:hypothetical protein
MEIQLGINLCDGGTVADLSTITTGANLKFYDVATSGTVLNPADVLVAGDYYVQIQRTDVKVIELCLVLF